MVIVDLFSKRQKRERGETIEVFTYDHIPPPLRVQIVRIWDEALGCATDGTYHGSTNPVFRELHKMLATEMGIFTLDRLGEGDQVALVRFFSQDATTSEALDAIDLSFRLMRFQQRNFQWRTAFNALLDYADAVDILNRRFLEHGVGYAFIDGDDPRLIRKDNELLHREAVLPALHLLHEQTFKGADEEYRSAHGHYRNGEHKECLNDCLKAFESTMKTICDRRKWSYGGKATASSLIETCLKNGLLPEFMRAHFGVVKSALESSIPTVRNNMGGHGQGANPKEAPGFYAEYLLQETAVTIVFLVQAYKAL